MHHVWGISHKVSRRLPVEAHHNELTNWENWNKSEDNASVWKQEQICNQFHAKKIKTIYDTVILNTANVCMDHLCPEMTLIRCTLNLTSNTKCPFKSKPFLLISNNKVRVKVCVIFVFG